MDINNRNRIVSFQTSPDRDEILVVGGITEKQKSHRDAIEIQFNKPHPNYVFRFYPDNSVGEIFVLCKYFVPTGLLKMKTANFSTDILLLTEHSSLY
jgi:hypothetical protein